MKALIALFAIAALAAAGIAQARDLGPDEALKLRDAGTIQSFETLNAAALALQPGGKIEETELEEEYGRYIYQVEVRDAQGVRWDIELDASNGQILKNQQDD
ncbi:PepSY domain-containing protein [Pseudomonas sp. sp1636]|uniref:PepSY domain-containing protein n=1 Tax=Pseudomonas sp. sp1636 TaxID=3036707 RepID=UPI0025A511F2|nr:PepSY domain-containing protein [Pseudomonas sp. sp1636]MDM8349605.1 PepSY domain-containing protein [Pseudomonas sp. sp1636]